MEIENDMYIECEWQNGWRMRNDGKKGIRIEMLCKRALNR